MPFVSVRLAYFQSFFFFTVTEVSNLSSTSIFQVCLRFFINQLQILLSSSVTSTRLYDMFSRVPFSDKTQLPYISTQLLNRKSFHICRTAALQPFSFSIPVIYYYTTAVFLLFRIFNLFCNIIMHI